MILLEFIVSRKTPCYNFGKRRKIAKIYLLKSAMYTKNISVQKYVIRFFPTRLPDWDSQKIQVMVSLPAAYMQ